MKIFMMVTYPPQLIVDKLETVPAPASISAVPSYLYLTKKNRGRIPFLQRACRDSFCGVHPPFRASLLIQAISNFI